VQRHTEVGEETRGALRGKRAQDAPDDPRRATPEVVLGDDAVGDVAAGSAADEDLGAGVSRAFEQQNAARRVEAARENGGGETGGACSDDGDVAGRGKTQPPKLTRIPSRAPAS
jgi:hypothetical protein